MFSDYIQEVRPNLSQGTCKAYSHQLGRIAQFNNLKDKITPLFFITRLLNKSKRDKTLNFIMLPLESLQSQNMRLSATKLILIANKENFKEKDFNRFERLLNDSGKTIREEITRENGENVLNEKEEIAFKTSWDSITEFAKNYQSLSPTCDRDYVILNLILNNDELIDGVKYNVLLRVLEYASLRLWNHKRHPPDNHKNYLWMSKGQLYIQHSKTTGGVKAMSNDMVRAQDSVKTYPVSQPLMDSLNTYIKTNKIKHDTLLWDGGSGGLTTNSFGKLFKKLLSPLNDFLAMGMIRKIYSNRPLPLLNHNQKTEMNRRVDHTIETESAFYKKNQPTSILVSFD